MSQNPYIYRGPVRAAQMFFGRQHELREIVAFLNGNQSVSIIGPRKIGKTSLLFQLQRREYWAQWGLHPNSLLVYLDCEVLGSGSHEEIFAAFAGEIIAALDDRLLPLEPELEAVLDKPTRLSFERAIRKLNQSDLRVVLILDEFERLSSNANLDVNFFNALRSAAGRYQLAFVTASAQPLIQLTYSGRSQEILSSPFFNIFAPLFLGMLPEEEARQAICRPAEANWVGFPSSVEDFIYGLVGGYPLGIQIAGFHAFELLHTSPTPDLVELEHRTMQELTPHFEYYWHNLSLAEQDALRRINDLAARAHSDTTLRTLLRDLVQKCLLVQEGGGYRYPMRAWSSFVYGQAVPAAIAAAQENGTLTGTQLGPYEVLELLGRGGMAEVYKGRHNRLERIVAVKILPARPGGGRDTSQSQFAQRFEREARAVASLRHPNIVEVFDFGDIQGTYYMVMEFIQGEDLSRLLHQVGRLELEQARSILTQLASALDHAHSVGLVHRDIKPSNVMLEGMQAEEPTTVGAHPPVAARPAAYRAVLTDFGIAKILGGDTAATQTGMLMGTLDYMAPEQIRSSGQVDHRADIYSLGAMAYQVLTGQLPMKGDNPGAVMMAHLQTPPNDPRTIRSDLSEKTAKALLCALAKDPDERFISAGEFIKGLF